jgi:intracellular septation protein A
MKTLREHLPVVTFFISFFVAAVSVYLKLNHSPYGHNALITAMVLIVLFIVTAIIEVSNSQKINHNEKMLWIFGLVFFNSFAGFFYLLSRNRIV